MAFVFTSPQRSHFSSAILVCLPSTVYTESKWAPVAKNEVSNFNDWMSWLVDVCLALWTKQRPHVRSLVQLLAERSCATQALMLTDGLWPRLRTLASQWWARLHGHTSSSRNSLVVEGWNGGTFEEKYILTCSFWNFLLVWSLKMLRMLM